MAAGAPDGRASLPRYETQYYVIHTDADAPIVREAQARLTAMAREYARRTARFGVLKGKLPFYLFTNRDDYRAAGGPDGSAGMFTGSFLAAVVSPDAPQKNWRTVQHEAFHQYAQIVISRKLPVWVDEGMAEYFGMGIWTGDELVVGAVPSWRAERVQTAIRQGQQMPLAKILALGRDEWNARCDLRDYDHVWSMMHFLIHADDGRYVQATEEFIGDIAAGQPWRQAFDRRFAGDVEGFEQRYRQWWLAQDPQAGEQVGRRAVLATLSSFLARASASGQSFTTAAAFFEAAAAGQLKLPPDQWLPPALLAETLGQARQMQDWSLEANPRPALTLKTPGKPTLTATFELRGGKVVAVNVRTE